MSLVKKNGLFFPAFLTAVLVISCGSPQEDPADFKDPPSVLVPHAIDEEGNPVFADNRLYAEDYSNALHAVFMVAGSSRQSELGHENYRPDLYDEMGIRARKWLDLVDVTDDFFNSSGRVVSWFEETETEEGIKYHSSNSADLSLYPHLVYSYHMHHRGSRFKEQGLYQEINYRPLNYVVSPGRYLLNEHYESGAFFNDDGSIDAASMSHGLGGIHGHLYAWVVWAKPDGADNMGLVPENRLKSWLQHSRQDLVEIALEITQFLDSVWDESASVYNFADDDNFATGLMPSSTAIGMAAGNADGNVWTLEQLGALIRGHKGLYETLYMFGETKEAQTAAERLFDRSAAIFDAVSPLVKPWGLPAEIRFEEGGATAASDVVDVYDTWQFINHLGGGFAWDREREGTAGFIAEKRPDIHNTFGEMCDMLLLGALEHQMPDGRLVSSLSYESGEVGDARTTVSASGMFITAAGNTYRNGSAFERASDWDTQSEETVAQSRLLYDAMMHHLELIEGAIVEP